MDISLGDVYIIKIDFIVSLFWQDQRIASLTEALELAKQSKEQAQKATRRALMEEQERSAQYHECLKVIYS